MASTSTPISDDDIELQGEQTEGDLGVLETEISQPKEDVQVERVASVQERIMEKKTTVEWDAAHHSSLAMKRAEDSSKNKSSPGNMLLYRMKNPIGIIRSPNDQGPTIHVTATLPKVEKIPRYTTWAYTERSRKTAEDQRVIGKRHIIPDTFRGKAVDVNEGTDAPVEEKHNFTDEEMRIIRTVSQKYELSDDVIETLQKHIGGTAAEIYEAFIMLQKQQDEETLNSNVPAVPDDRDYMEKLLDKSLDSCMHTFDALFCRRCLIFDCRIHGINQPVIYPALKHPVESPDDENDQPCTNQCYKIATAKYPERGGSSNTNPESVKESSKQDVVWRRLEKDLYLMGLEMFGRNSCRIARNVMFNFKSCIEVYNYMNEGGPEVSSTEINHKESEILSTLESLQKKNKENRHLKSREHLHRQYNPCGCKLMCGKDCPCLENSICCEKYCGCPKGCKNRHRGCYCFKNQCINKQCPCFAAGRECDPDVCRNCCVSLGSSEKEGQCGNMRILLGQHKRILMGISNVAGWGAFTWDTIEKDDYLGEYTGELISHEEADGRGKQYDQNNSSFLFNLNDESVIDASRIGNKLKFANHSAKPNCEPKIIKVRGDHHVGIFTKQRIQAGAELFYDYHYLPELAPLWARNPNDPDEGPSVPPHARSKKPRPNNPEEGPSVPPHARSKKPRPNNPEEGPSVPPRARSKKPRPNDPEEGPSVQAQSKKPRPNDPEEGPSVQAQSKKPPPHP